LKEAIRVFTREKNSPFQIEMAGKSWCDGSYTITRKQSNVWVIEYIQAGKGTVEVTDTEKRVCYPEKGDVYLLPPGKRHHYYSDAQEPWEKIFVNFKGPVADRLAECYGIEEMLHFSGVEYLESSFCEIFTNVEDKELEEEEVVRRIELMLHDIFRSLGRKNAVKRAESEEISQVMRYLDANVGRLVSIGEMAELIYRSPDYLIKHFRAETGMTPYRYLMKRKMQVAEKLLRDTALPVGEVAAQLGYDDAHYFSGLFKKERGVSPLKYRRG